MANSMEPPGAPPSPSTCQQGPCSGWMPRAHARHCTRVSDGRHPDVEPVRRCRRNLVRNDVCQSWELPWADLQDQSCRDFTSLAGLHGLRAGVVRARDGRLYCTGTGGATGAGSVSRIEANGAVTVLHNFNGSDGVSPVAELVEIDDGTFVRHDVIRHRHTWNDLPSGPRHRVGHDACIASVRDPMAQRHSAG